MSSERVFLGIHAGSGCDGLELALVSARGRRSRLGWKLLASLHVPFDDALSARLRDVLLAQTVDPAAIAQADADLSHFASDAVAGFLNRRGLKPADIRAAGLAGPVIARAIGGGGGSTLGLCSPELVGHRLGMPVVAGFDSALAARHRPGLCWSSWPAWKLLRDKRLSRVLVRLGGLAQAVFIGSAAHAAEATCCDCGPCGVVLDAMARRLFHRPFDADGAIAARGKVNGALLNELQADPWFAQSCPRSAVVAQWGSLFMQRLELIAARHGCDGADLVATATEWAARCVVDQIGRWTEVPHEVILCGGASLNIHLAARIRAMLSPSSTYTSARYGYDARGLWPAMLAMLASARIDELPIPLAADSQAVLGVVYRPG